MIEQRRAYRPTGWRSLADHWLAALICVLAITTLGTGLRGFVCQYADTNAKYDSAQPAEPAPNQDWSIPIYKTVQLFLLGSGSEDDLEHPSNWWLVFARLSAAVLFLVISSAIIFRVLDDVRSLPRQLMRRDHSVICGLGQIGLQLLDDLKRRSDTKDIVVVEYNPANPWLDYARSLGATIVVGDSTKASNLLKARVQYAREIFVVNGDDGVNLEVTAELSMLLADESRKEKPLQAYVHIVDTNFANTLQPHCKVLDRSEKMQVQVFNVPRTAATRLVTHQLWPHAPKAADEVAHFVILGFGAMGQALAVQLAQLAHYQNQKRSRFTIADHNIKSLAAKFFSRFPRFTSWENYEQIGVNDFPALADHWQWNNHPLPDHVHMDSPEAIQYASNAEFVEIPSGRTDEQFAAHITKHFRQAGVKPVIFICGERDLENFEMAVQLRDQLTCVDHSDVPLFVWLPRQPALAETLSRTAAGKFYPFGECRASASYDEITNPLREIIGREIHEDYERQAQARSVEQGKEYTKTSWREAPDDFRESSRVAADHMLIKLNCVGVEIIRKTSSNQNGGRFTKDYSPAVKKRLAEMEHARWIAERLLAGWRHCPKGANDEEIRAYKKLKLNHNITTFENSETAKDFDQIEVIFDACQNLDGFLLKRLNRTEDTPPGSPTKQTPLAPTS